MKRHVLRVVLVLLIAGLLQLACNVGAGGGTAEQTAVAGTLTAIASQRHLWPPPTRRCRPARHRPLPARRSPPPPH